LPKEACISVPYGVKLTGQSFSPPSELVMLKLLNGRCRRSAPGIGRTGMTSQSLAGRITEALARNVPPPGGSNGNLPRHQRCERGPNGKDVPRGAPAMYDLSWLNRTPHAIAVYASHPLSPVATQHSLPSGRYSLLGPDSYEAPRVKGGDLAALATRQCGIEDTATPSPSWRRWSSPEAACGAPKAQGLRNVASSVIIRLGLLRSAVVDLPSI
jgi:hypothetical protein